MTHTVSDSTMHDSHSVLCTLSAAALHEGVEQHGRSGLFRGRLSGDGGGDGISRCPAQLTEVKYESLWRRVRGYVYIRGQ